MDKKRMERGLYHLIGWIHFSIASGVPEAIVWEWLFHTKAEKPEIIADDITFRVDELIQSGEFTVRQMFDIATESIFKDSAYNAKAPNIAEIIDDVQEHLKDAIQLWDEGK